MGALTATSLAALGGQDASGRRHARAG